MRSFQWVPMVFLFAGCEEPEAQEDQPESGLEQRVADLEAAQAESDRGLQEQIDALAAQVESQGQQLAAAESEIETLSAAVAELEGRVDGVATSVSNLELEVSAFYETFGLQVSSYEVDCNAQTLLDTQITFVDGEAVRNAACILVDGIDPTDFPLVQVVQDNTMLATDCIDYGGSGGICSMGWTAEFQIGIFDGGQDRGSAYSKMMGPGVQLRFDPVTQQIYTAGHHRSCEDSSPAVYHVTVVGSRAYAAP